MKGFKLLMVAALATVWMSSCTEGTEQVSKPMGDASSDVAQTTSKKKADKNDNNYDALSSQKADAKAKEKNAGSSSETLAKTSIAFEAYDHDFGVIDEGDRVEHLFKFKNTGSEPLILEKCKGSCGCTVPECPKEPIAPGAEGEIKVVFNSKGKKNKQTKTVTITANTEPIQTQLKIMANVTPETPAQ